MLKAPIRRWLAFMMMLLALLPAPCLGEAASDKASAIQGAVTKVMINSISLTGDDGIIYRFAISRHTGNPDAAKIGPGTTVSVAYGGVYADGCEALSVTLVKSLPSQDKAGSAGKEPAALTQEQPDPDQADPDQLDGEADQSTDAFIDPINPKGPDTDALPDLELLLEAAANDPTIPTADPEPADAEDDEEE